MLKIPFISSYVFAFTALLYSILAFLIIGLNSKKKLYRVFFFLGISGSIWSLFNALAINSGYYYSSYFFYLIAILGSFLFYPIVLHITKIFFNKKRNKLFLLCNYLPLILILISYFIMCSFSFEPIKIVSSEWGFSFIFSNTYISVLSFVYFIIYTILIIYNMKDVYKKASVKKYSKLVNLICSLYILASVLHIFVEFLFINFYFNSIMHFSSIFYIIPLCFLFVYLIKNRKKYFIDEFNLIEGFDKNSKRGIFSLLSLFYIVLGYSNLLLDVLISGNLDISDLKGLLMFFLIAIVHILFVDIIADKKLQNIFLFITAIVVECVVLVVYKDFFAINIWTLIFLYVILMSVFEDSIYIYLTLFIVLLINTIFMLRAPIGVVWFSESNHLMRTIIFVMLFIFVIYINSIFKKRRQEVKIGYQTKNVVSDFLEGLISLNFHNLDDKIVTSLQQLNSGFGFISSSFFMYSINTDNSLHKILNVESNQKRVFYNYDETIFSILPDYLTRIKSGEKIYIPVLNEAVDISDYNKQVIMARGIEGFFAFPVFLEGKLKAIIVFEFKNNAENKFIGQYEPIIKNIIIEMIKKVESEKKIFIRNNYDSATDLMKKDYFRECTEEIIHTIPNEYYLIYVDILNFEFINKYIGHFNSDSLLRDIANKLKSVAGQNITRVGSGDFVIFIEASEEKIYDVIDEIKAKIKAGIKSNKDIFNVEINFGVAKVESDIEETLKNASIAVQKINRDLIKDIQFYDDKIKSQILEEQDYAKRLENALKNNEFSLNFQPQIDAKTEKIIGAESLLRWRSEGIGYVSPYIFIPILESTGHIIDVGYWVIEEAIKESLKLRKMGYDDVMISINLSPIQFLDKNLKHVIEKLSEKYGVDNSLIEFEITESVAINEHNIVLDLFKEIKDMGFHIAIDDFGTGYSSLNRLQYFPIDRLKIDKSFIDGIGVDTKKEIVVELILDLSKKLNLKSIAEGVEYQEQLEYLRELGCDEIQGYYYAKPMPKDEFEEFIKSY